MLFSEDLFYGSIFVIHFLSKFWLHYKRIFIKHMYKEVLYANYF